MNKPISYKFQEDDWKNKKVFAHIFPDITDNAKYDDYCS